MGFGYRLLDFSMIIEIFDDYWILEFFINKKIMISLEIWICISVYKFVVEILNI